MIASSHSNLNKCDRCFAEQSLLRELEGGCQVPIGVNTHIDGNTLTLTGMVSSLDGQRLVKDRVSGPAETANQLGQDLANRLKEEGAGEILAEILAEIDRS